MSSVSYDHLIVGAGFAGATSARILADAGKRVLIIDKRNHFGGNAYDYVNEHGVRIHKYGPHIFHTNSDKVFAFLSRFTEWRPYEHRVLASVEGRLLPFPINLTTMEMVFERSFTEEEAREFVAGEVANSWEAGREINTAEDQCLSTVGRRLYDLFFKGYSTKMWGRDPSELDKSVTARIPLRFDRDDRYFTDKHQSMPRDGYAAMFERMLDHPNIQVDLNVGICTVRGFTDGRGLIWTGPIDEFFGEQFGPLPYRSMEFVGATMLPERGNAATVNEPSHPTRTRVTNMQKLSGCGSMAYMLAEYPCAKGEPYYPIPSPESAALYKSYQELADAQDNVTFIGRLGRYQYLNMDQVVAQAMTACERLLG